MAEAGRGRGGGVAQGEIDQRWCWGRWGRPDGRVAQRARAAGTGRMLWGWRGWWQVGGKGEDAGGQHERSSRGRRGAGERCGDRGWWCGASERSNDLTGGRSNRAQPQHGGGGCVGGMGMECERQEWFSVGGAKDECRSGRLPPWDMLGCGLSVALCLVSKQCTQPAALCACQSPRARAP